MKKLLLGVLLLFCCTNLLADTERHRRENPKDLMGWACDYLSVNCKGLEPPQVIYTDIMGAMGLYGAYYPGEGVVWVDWDAPAHTVIHEITHYMLYEAGIPLSRCTSEEAARRVHHAWQGTKYNDKWRAGYGCVRSS